MKVERAVIDTNVLISAALSSGSIPAQIVHCLLEHATLVFSRETFEELETRLWRPKFDRYVDIDHRRLLLQRLAAVALWIDLPVPPRPVVSRDPDDDVFLYTALHGDAQWLISGDKDVLEIPPEDWGFDILSPAQALEIWRRHRAVRCARAG